MRSSEASAGSKSVRGFTLIELLVVISIIGLLSSVVLASLQTARARAGNAARNSDVNQYLLASELAWDARGYYPTPTGLTTSLTSTWICVGDYPDNKCGANGTTYNENAGFNADFSEFFPALPFQPGLVGNFEGYVSVCQIVTDGKCQQFQMRWYLKESGQSCGPGQTGTLTQPAGLTYCQVCHPDRGYGACAL